MKISVISPSIRPNGLEFVRDSLMKQTEKDFELLVEVNTTGEPDFNAASNKMLKRAKGELVVFLQDYIKIEPDGLEKMWKAYQDNPNTFFTAPVGQTLDWENIAWDWRTQRTKAEWMEWEIDWGAAPLSYLKKIGGFDEELDEFWSFDNVNVAYRAELEGYKFMCLQDNPAVAFNHDAVMEHPFRKLRNPNFHNARLQEFKMGLKLDPL